MASAPRTERTDTSPSLLVRAIWFVLVGWWASAVWLGVAWFFVATIILTPIGIKMINRVPWIVSLKDRPIESERITADGVTTVREGRREQRSLLVRAIWFLLVGWWASGIWMSIAWALTVSIVGLPVAIWMYGKLPFVVSLYRY